MKSYEERREELRKYNADVTYEIWRGGGNPDAADFDRIQDGFHEGTSSDELARHELRLQRKAREEKRELEQQEEYSEPE